jgi:hypothetical protein
MKPDPMIKCPCCHGSGQITERSPVRLTPLQFRIWDIVRRADGISAADLIQKVYSQHWEGGPINAAKSVCVTVHHANKRLATVNQRIVSSRGRGSLYRLQYLDSK